MFQIRVDQSGDCSEGVLVLIRDCGKRLSNSGFYNKKQSSPEGIRGTQDIFMVEELMADKQVFLPSLTPLSSPPADLFVPMASSSSMKMIEGA
jgi:hypothetical protein